jgi:hypothetical protein
MKNLTLILAMSALCLVNARAESIPEKAANATDTARTAENVAHAAVRHTKEAVNTVADALTPEPGARHVDVSLNEDRIDMPTSMPRGRTAFIVHNAGQRKHNLGSLTTSHIERAFLSVRQELKRFQRKGLGFSKDLDMHKAAVALYFGVTTSCAVTKRSKQRQRSRRAWN